MTLPKAPGGGLSRKVWIDLDNTPHVPFFVPIMEELQARGYSVFLTARDSYQVCGLADLFHLSYERIGKHYGKNKLMKLLGTLLRTLQLLPVALREKPALALSHGSRAQILAAKLAGIPSLVMFDYEFATMIPGAHPTYLMAPEVIQSSHSTNGSGGVLTYPGIKEDVYVPRFVPDPKIKELLGLEEDSIVVTLRPPAIEAHYHNPESEILLQTVIETLTSNDRVKVVLVPRNDRQAHLMREMWAGHLASRKVTIPDQMVDGLNLIWHSDLVISGGGTMNREAAAMDVPVYSIFRGQIGSVDRYLAASGRLVLLESSEDVRRKLVLQRRTRPREADMGSRNALGVIVNHVVAILEGRCAA